MEYADGKDGYVAAEYTTIAEEFVYAKTIEEEAAELAAAQALMERTQQQEADAPEVLTKIEFPATTYSSNAELRQAVVDYGLQFLGNRYIHGGSSLVTGTDCSGFTCFIYRDFGYAISRTPTGQLCGKKYRLFTNTAGRYYLLQLQWWKKLYPCRTLHWKWTNCS